MKKRLGEIADMLRSKNAGPLNVTFDIMFSVRKNYERVLASGVISRELIAGLYKVPVEDVAIISYDIVNSIKITIPRKHVSGDIDDDDIYGCQQHMPLANIMIPCDELFS